MVDTFGMIFFALLALVAIYVFLWLMGKPYRVDHETGRQETTVPLEKGRAEMSDEEFIDSYTAPMLEDALDVLDSAVDSIKSGLDFYKRCVWEAAGDEFHAAAKGIDGASLRLRDVVAMVEDPGSKPSTEAKARLEQCRQLRALTIRMEEACDARVEGKEDEAKRLDEIMPGLESLAINFKK